LATFTGVDAHEDEQEAASAASTSAAAPEKLRRFAKPSSFLFLRSLIVVSALDRRASSALTDFFTDLLLDIFDEISSLL
jgi:hypothetical protein